MRAVPGVLLDAVREVLTEHADELGIKRDSIRRLTPHAVTARTSDGGLLRLDVSAYARSELSR
jgi:hypothetical protein